MRCLAIAIVAVLGAASLVGADVITGTGAGAAHVNVFNGTTGALVRSFLPFGGYTGGVSVSSGDVDGDTTSDIIVGAGPGALGGHVKVFHGTTGAQIRSFLAFPGFAGGVTVASGQIGLGGGFPLSHEIIVGAGPGAPGGHVKVFDGETGAVLQSFFAYPGFNGGVTVAGAEISGGRTDIIAGGGAGVPNGQVKAFDGDTGDVIHNIFAFPGYSGGINVAGGDVDGDFVDDIIVGAMRSAGGHVKVLDGVTGAEIRSFFAFPGFTGGVWVGCGDVNGDGRKDVIVSTGAGSVGSQVKVFDGVTGAEIRSFVAYPGFGGAVLVGGL